MTVTGPLPWFPVLSFIANFSVLLLYGFDKHQAVLSGRRISERTLLLSAVIAPFGALFGMVLFRHKTRTLKFVFMVPVFIAVHGMFIVLILIHG
jgi:uncharacterized membrane protein YsdA (DUF1294 family)